ncbi:unnamed protein product [marine sediment metagenome]|uniref:Uncharacterized protein n=1 Tax=marine sediment metagenome TaxID=412755 RepID=X0YY20_9ZZZZ
MFKILGIGYNSYKTAFEGGRIKAQDNLFVKTNSDFEHYIVNKDGSLEVISVFNKKTDLKKILSRKNWYVEYR